MQHEAELHFFQKLLEQFHLNFRILCDSHGTIPDPDLGLRRLLNPDTDYLLEFQRLCSHCKPQRVYKIQDEFFCHYFFFRLPEGTETAYALLGPYRLSNISTESLLENAKKLSFPDSLLLQLQLYYQSLTTVSDEQLLLPYTFSVLNFSVEWMLFLFRKSTNLFPLITSLSLNVRFLPHRKRLFSV